MSQENYNKDIVQDEIVAITGKITALLDSYRDLCQPLEESQKKVPNATRQLDKITEQTEAATQKMLDTVEHLTRRQEEMIGQIEKISRIITDKIPEQKTIIDDIAAIAKSNNNDAFDILDALQFQDITAQQMNFAIELLQELEFKLAQVIKRMQGEIFDPESRNYDNIQRAYDPNADMINRKTNQVDIDDLFEKNKKIPQ